MGPPAMLPVQRIAELVERARTDDTRIVYVNDNYGNWDGWRRGYGIGAGRGLVRSRLVSRAGRPSTHRGEARCATVCFPDRHGPMSVLAATAGRVAGDAVLLSRGSCL